MEADARILALARAGLGRDAIAAVLDIEPADVVAARDADPGNDPVLDIEIEFGTTPGYELGSGVEQGGQPGGLSVRGERAFGTGFVVKPVGMAAGAFSLLLADLIVAPNDLYAPLLIGTYDYTLAAASWTAISTNDNGSEPWNLYLSGGGDIPTPPTTSRVAIFLAGINFGIVT